MGPPHYALSEALIVLVALWVALRFARKRAWLGAAGVAIFGAAAAVGTYRFASGHIEALAQLHRIVSQAGGACAMALVALQLALGRTRIASRGMIFGSIALSIAMLVASLSLPKAATLLFVLWLIVAIGAAWRLPAEALGQRARRAALVSLLLFNFLLVRQSAVLGPALSWHLFHVLVAVWLLAVWLVLLPSSVARENQNAATPMSDM